MLFVVMFADSAGNRRCANIIAHDADSAREIAEYDAEGDEVVISVTLKEKDSKRKQKLLLKALSRKEKKESANGSDKR